MTMKWRVVSKSRAEVREGFQDDCEMRLVGAGEVSKVTRDS